MSDSGYWTGLLITVLVIGVAFFCLFLGASIFVFVYDRISVFELWNSPVWIKLKVPLIIIAVIAFLAGVIAVSPLSRAKRAAGCSGICAGSRLGLFAQ